MVNKYKRFLTLLCVVLMGSLCMFYENGPAANGVGATGSPFDGQYCASCHSGGNFSTTVSIQLQNSAGVTTTSYVPGTIYTVQVTVTGSNIISSTRYGFQITAADAGTNANAGTWGTLPANTHNTFLNSRNYIEHSTPLQPHIFKIQWTAPSGSSDIVFYAAGNIVNDDGFPSGDEANTATLTVTNPCNPITISPSTLPNGTTGIAYTGGSLSQTGGTGIITYSVTSGALPTGVSLSSSGTFSGTPSASGTYNFTITASSSAGCTGTASYTVVINCPTITLSPPSLSAGTTGAIYNATISESGSNGSSFNYSVTSGSLPTGLSLSTGGILSGTPSAAGTYNFTVTVTDNYGCSASKAYSIVISCLTPTLSPSTLSSPVTVGAAFNQSVTATGGNGTYSYTSSGALPTGLTLSSGGVLSGTTTATGTYIFTVTATNQYNCGASIIYTLTVNCPAITLNPSSLSAGTAGVSYGPQPFSVSGSTGTSTTYSVTAGALPTGLTLTAGGALSGMPSSGSYSFTVTAKDNYGCTATRAYSIAVTCPTTTITPATLPSVTAGNSYNQTISETGGNGTFIYSVTTGVLPTGMSLAATGAITGTPTVSGTYNFTITGSNQYGCSASNSYTVMVGCPAISLSPAAIGPLNVGVPVSQSITQTGGFGTFTYSVTAGSLPAGLALPTTGLLSGTPTVTGTYNFTVTATSGDGCPGTKAYSINIVCPAVSLAPSTLPNVPIGGAYSNTITETGGAGTFTYSVTAGTLPAGITLSSSGTLSGTSTFSGAYTFTITGTSQYGCSVSQAYSVSVTCPSVTLTPATLPNGNIGAAYTGNTISQTGGAGTFTYSVTSGALPIGINLASNGLLSGTPTANGTYNFTVTGTSNFNCTGTQAYTIVINCATITLSPVTLPSVTVGNAYNQTITSSGGTGTLTYSVTSGSLPTGVSLASNGAISGTPTVTGTYNFTITATDTYGCTGTKAFAVTIACPAIAISPTTMPDGIVGTSYSQSVSSSGGLGTISYTATGTLPSGLMFSGGILSGMLTTSGTYTFTITATDSFGCTGNNVYSIDVNCPAITLSPATLPDATKNITYSQTITQSGSNGTSFSYAVSSGTVPANLSLSAAGLLSGTPSQSGTYSFSISMTDNFGCVSTKAYTLIVNPSVFVGTIQSTGEGVNIVSLVPNVVTNKTTANITSGMSAKVKIAVIDLAGRVVYNDNVILNEGMNSIELDLSRLNAGTYLFEVKPGNNKPLKFVKL